jgi:hypothetical protein
VKRALKCRNHALNDKPKISRDHPSLLIIYSACCTAQSPLSSLPIERRSKSSAAHSTPGIGFGDWVPMTAYVSCSTLRFEILPFEASKIKSDLQGRVIAVCSSTVGLTLNALLITSIGNLQNSSEQEKGVCEHSRS